MAVPRPDPRVTGFLRAAAEARVRNELERCGLLKTPHLPPGQADPGRPTTRPVQPPRPRPRLRGRVRIPRVSLWGQPTERQRLRMSVEGLRRQRPEYSASALLTGAQATLVAVVAVIVVGALYVATRPTLLVGIALTEAVYVAVVAYRLFLFHRGVVAPCMETVTDEEARAVPAATLPVYTVLVPAYHEPDVVGPLLAAIDAFEYPHDKLDVKLLLEADDDVTIAAVRAIAPKPYVDVILVPPAEPRTKPKACNYGLTFARGSYVTIYDAEDRPEPLQLRRAVVAFERVGPRVACLQAKLSYYNLHQNLLTRWFTTEYDSWFCHLLPGLAGGRVPIPLGGTSNHLRREALDAVGGWDAHNVTEDCDLGVRLCREGWESGVLDSTTYEEANSDFINWGKQRSRWYKGYLQTWLVHMRHPRRLWREVGPSGFFGVNVLIGGTPILSLVNPVFWMLTVLWFVARPAFVAALFPAPLYYAGLLCWSLGNFAIVYSTMITVRSTGKPGLMTAAVLSPVYWGLMSVAAVKAVLQLLIVPTFWEKTVHGLARDRHAPPVEVAGGSY